MEENKQEFSLEDIIKEFSDQEEASNTPEEQESPVSEQPESVPEAPEKSEPQVSGDTIRIGDTIRMDAIQVPKAKTVRGAEPIVEEEPPPETPAPEEFSENWEPEYEQPMGEYVPPQPILFHPKSRLRELKRKLVAGPEKLYYDLSEKGCGKLQLAIFVNLLVVLLCAGATALYAMGMVPENRMRLMVFSQFLAMLLSALLGSYQLIEGISDLFHKRFSLNTMLVFTFIACVSDGVLCLQTLRVPCCAAFCLEMTMSLWNTYHRRSSQMGMMDTMRKANHLDGIGSYTDRQEGMSTLLRSEGQVEDFMDTYSQTPRPEKTLGIYGLLALLASIAIAVTAFVFYGLHSAVQVLAVSLLAAMPASAFIAVSRPSAVLERRLHKLGTVLCGWRSVEILRSKAVFPLQFSDLFPVGTVKMNGVKFYSSREPDEIVAYCTAVITAHGCGLAPLFTQVLDSRNGRHLDAEELQYYEAGGIGGEVRGEPVLVGSLSFLKDMGVEVPEGIRVSDAVCVAIDGELCGLFAISYEKDRASAGALTTLCAYRHLHIALPARDFMLTKSFIRSKFGVNPKRLMTCSQEQWEALAGAPEEDAVLPASLLVTSQGLAPFAFGVTGARALGTASWVGVVVHMIGGIVGLGMMLVLILLSALELLTPANMFLYQLVWMIPGLLITEWTRSV